MVKTLLKKSAAAAVVIVLSAAAFTGCSNPDKTEPVSSASSISEMANNENICSVSVKCETLIDKKSDAPKEIAEFIPDNGIILCIDEAAFEEGESAFDVLKRELTEEGILFEYESTPAYGSVYIEGINNIYEFDFGSGSGWMYRVNGEFPKMGCSQYILSPGDKVEWLYTCDFGSDVGGDDAIE